MDDPGIWPLLSCDILGCFSAGALGWVLGFAFGFGWGFGVADNFFFFSSCQSLDSLVESPVIVVMVAHPLLDRFRE